MCAILLQYTGGFILNEQILIKKKKKGVAVAWMPSSLCVLGLGGWENNRRGNWIVIVSKRDYGQYLIFNKIHKINIKKFIKIF